MKKYIPALDRILELTFKTTLSYFIFFLSFFSIPITQNIYAQFKEIKINYVDSAYVVLAETKLKVEIADTAEARTLGLSNRETLEDKRGMLFVFDEADRHGIWMKEMNFSIDVIWFNANYEVIYIVKDAKPDSYPKIFRPSTNAKYVLEVPSGFVEKEGIKIGDLINIF